MADPTVTIYSGSTIVYAVPASLRSDIIAFLRAMAGPGASATFSRQQFRDIIPGLLRALEATTTQTTSFNVNLPDESSVVSTLEYGITATTGTAVTSVQRTGNVVLPDPEDVRAETGYGAYVDEEYEFTGTLVVGE